MSSDLHQELRKIIGYSKYPIIQKECIEAIEKAFKSHGWTPPKKPISLEQYDRFIEDKVLRVDNEREKK